MKRPSGLGYGRVAQSMTTIGDHFLLRLSQRAEEDLLTQSDRILRGFLKKPRTLDLKFLLDCLIGERLRCSSAVDRSEEIESAAAQDKRRVDEHLL